MRDIAYGAAFAVIFAVVTAAAAFAIGYWWAVDYERTTGYGGGNAPVIVFVLATPIGALVGFFFGLWLASRPQRLSGPTEDRVNANKSSRHLRFWALVALALAVLAPAPAEANIGLPTIAMFLPALGVALVPIVLLEAALISRSQSISFTASPAGATLANVASTIVGVPLLWFLLATVELICCGGALGLGSTWVLLH